jgi:hypothetical protein
MESQFWGGRTSPVVFRSSLAFEIAQPLTPSEDHYEEA